MEIKNSIDKTRQGNETNYPCQDMPKRIGNLYGDDRGTGFAGNVWNKNAISPTITTCQGGGREPMILDSFIVAMRGRNPEHPTDRTPGIHTEQRLEMNKDGLVNTLTTVQKDNLVLEQDCKIKKVGQISNDGSQCGTVVSEKVLFPTISAGTHGYANPHLLTQYRIRKLTPKECWRLMGYTDKDFDKASAVNSNTQLYKEAGNAIVKQVLMAIFSQMNIKGVKPWNDMTSEEKYNLIQKSTSEEKTKRTWG